MGRSTNVLTDFHKARIIACYEAGKSINRTAEVLGVKASTCRSFYSKMMKDYGLPPREKSSNSKISARMGLTIKKLLNFYPTRGVRKLTAMLRFELPGLSWYPHFTTVHRFMVKNGFLKKKHSVKPPITEINRAKRLEFALKWIGEEEDKLGVVIWSDETMVRSHPFTRRLSSWVAENTPAPIQEKHHSGNYSVMFWGCISVMGRGSLTVINGTMDHIQYLKVLREDFLPEATVLINRGIPVKLMHDNAPCHVHRDISTYIRRSEVEFIDWPPYSPDLNPIENVWAWVKYKLYSEFPPAESKNQLIDFVFECWETLDDQMCIRYCRDYNKRLSAVVTANGGPTKY